MITSRACDLCHRPLPAEVVRLTVRSGQVTYLVQQRWKLQSTRAGLQVLMICTGCSEYLDAALAHLAAYHRGARGGAAAPGGVGSQLQREVA